jgi:hypothetical protein
MCRRNHPAPRVINTDGHASYPPAVAQLKAEGDLTEDCRHRPVPYLNNVLERDHRAIKRRVNGSQHFRSFWAAWRTIAGYEAIHMIRKGQAFWSAADVKLGPLHHFILGLFAASAIVRLKAEGNLAEDCRRRPASSAGETSATNCQSNSPLAESFVGRSGACGR